MSSWMNNLRNLGRGPSQQRSTPNQQTTGNPPSRGGNSSPSANNTSSLAPQSIPPTPASPSLTATTMQANQQAHQTKQSLHGPNGKLPLFFREKFCGFMVKGNFMTLGAKPFKLEEAEWIAHQVVEQNRLLSGMVKIVQTEDRTTGQPICNQKDCMIMSAGPATWFWYDTRSQPIHLAAPIYIKHIQTWVAGKIQDETLFPTNNFTTAPPEEDPQHAANDPNHWLGKTSGFPQRLETEVKNMYKQMFRVYAHLYWQHWLAFWDLSAYRDLNTCFIHFINVGRVFNLLNDKDTEVMQPLIDLWVARGDLPKLTENGTAATPAASTPATTTTTAATATATAASSSASAVNAQPSLAASG